MKKYLVVIFALFYSLNSNCQFVFKDGKSTAKVDTITSNSDTIYFYNKTSKELSKVVIRKGEIIFQNIYTFKDSFATVNVLRDSIESLRKKIISVNPLTKSDTVNLIVTKTALKDSLLKYLKLTDTVNLLVTYYELNKSFKDVKNYIDSINSALSNKPSGIFNPSLELSTSQTLYEAAVSSKAHSVKVICKIYRPSGCDSITSLKLNNVTKTLPSIYAKSTVYDTLTVSLYNNTNSIYETQKYTVALSSANGDTVKASLNLYLGYKAYFYAYDIDNVVTALSPGNTYLNTSYTEIISNGLCSITNFAAGGNNILIAIPSELSTSIIKFNGLVYSLPSIKQEYINVTNNYGQTRSYTCFYTPSKIINKISTIEIQ